MAINKKPETAKVAALLFGLMKNKGCPVGVTNPFPCKVFTPKVLALERGRGLLEGAGRRGWEWGWVKADGTKTGQGSCHFKALCLGTVGEGTSLGPT